MRTARDLPGPKPLPLLGNFHQLDKLHLDQGLNAWADEFGPVFTFKLFQRRFVAFLKLESILAALRDRPTTFRRVGSVEAVFNEMGANGLFAAEGEEWRRQRALTMPAFASQHLIHFFGTLSTVTERLARRWEKPATEGTDVEAQKDLLRFTVDITTNLAFGYDMNTLEQGEDVIQHHLEKIFPVISRRVIAPFPYWRYFKLPLDRDMDKSMAIIVRTIEEFISSARARLRAQPERMAKPSNFLEGLLVGPDNQLVDISNSDLIGNLLTILLAGEDTTANAMAWMLYLISKHPDVQKKMQAEADEVLGEATQPTSYQQVGKLPYIEAVVMESLRVRPVASFLFLQSNVDTELEGVALPKGSIIALLTGHAGMQDENFSDARQFRPERWLAPPANHNPRALLVFGEGPRFCPGRNLALLEMKTVGAMVARRFNVSAPRNGTEPVSVHQFVTVARNLWLRFDKRGT